MTTHVHDLAGCAAAPLANYLKALAILRLVSEQADASARGFWQGESFRFATKLSKDDLVRFFLDEYSPTPILSPWNGGSGFFYEDDVALGPLERSTAARFAPFRDGIAAARAVCAPLAAAIATNKAADEALKKNRKDEALKAEAARAKAARDEAKAGLIPACRRAWTDGLLEWFDAAIVVGADGDAAWPALLGSGGNDGRLDFTHNSMEHIARLLDCGAPHGKATPLGRAMLPAALFGATSPGLAAFAAGQFMPGRAGGDNMGQGFDGESLVNSWDFVLMLEGTVVLASGLARRADGEGLPQAAAPFAVRSGAAGYGSADRADEGPRGEQWMPLWSQPSRYSEVRSLFAEGRVRMGREAVTRAMDVPRALARLGTARGVTSFERFGFIERNGQSNLAVPLGRWSVSNPERREDLLDDVERWVSRFRAVAREAHVPRSISSAGRTLDESFLAVCRPGGDSLRWHRLLEALGDAEAALLGSPKTAADPKKRLSPLPPLRPEWVTASDDGTPEHRLAVALASQTALFRSRGSQVRGSIRAHWLPVDHATGARGSGRFAIAGSTLKSDPDVVCRGHDLERDCLALVRRRVQMAGALEARMFGLAGTEGYEANTDDVMSFLDGAVDGRRVMRLARALMAVRWEARRAARHQQSMSIDPAYAILRLAHFDEAPAGGSDACVRLDPEPVARLAAGDLQGAVEVCLRRLRASGLVPKLRVVVADRERVRRLLASLAFPIPSHAVTRCRTLVTKPDHDDPTEGQPR
jgi:CRISPR-associated protein Csx17